MSETPDRPTESVEDNQEKAANDDSRQVDAEEERTGSEQAAENAELDSPA